VTPEQTGGGSPLYSLVYASFATKVLDDADLDALLRRAREHNGARGISGLLLYRRGRFVQFLEGPEDEVRALYAKIRTDPRHVSPRILNEGRPDHRQFADWTMGYEPVREADVPPPPGFRSTFDDLDDADDSDSVIRATQELSLWFRVRTRDVAGA
jgi:hypothetical protein